MGESKGSYGRRNFGQCYLLHNLIYREGEVTGEAALDSLATGDAEAWFNLQCGSSGGNEPELPRSQLELCTKLAPSFQIKRSRSRPSLQTRAERGSKTMKRGSTRWRQRETRSRGEGRCDGEWTTMKTLARVVVPLVYTPKVRVTIFQLLCKCNSLPLSPLLFPSAIFYWSK